MKASAVVGIPKTILTVTFEKSTLITHRMTPSVVHMITKVMSSKYKTIIIGVARGFEKLGYSVGDISEVKKNEAVYFVGDVVLKNE